LRRISVLTPEPKAVYPKGREMDYEIEIEFQCSPLSRRLCTARWQLPSFCTRSISVLTPEPKAVY